MNSFVGEIISLVVAVSWTMAALFAEIASRYASVTVMNVVRMFIALPLFFLLLFFTTGSCLPMYADVTTWVWLSLAGLVGYVFGDICLFRSYQEMGARYTQLFMTLAPLFSAFGGWVMLEEQLSPRTLLAIVIILTGIGMSVFTRGGDDEHGLHLKISWQAALLGVGASMGQGFGLVVSKIGMISYENALPAGVDPQTVMMPFAATFIRCAAALVGFIIILVLRKQIAGVPKMIANFKAMGSLTLATIFGPIVGVSLSLLAVCYTSTGVAATLMALVPIFILLPSRIFMHQRITKFDIMGTIVAVAGVAVIFL